MAEDHAVVVVTVVVVAFAIGGGGVLVVAFAVALVVVATFFAVAFNKNYNAPMHRQFYRFLLVGWSLVGNWLVGRSVGCLLAYLVVWLGGLVVGCCCSCCFLSLTLSVAVLFVVFLAVEVADVAVAIMLLQC